MNTIYPKRTRVRLTINDYEEFGVPKDLIGEIWEIVPDDIFGIVYGVLFGDALLELLETEFESIEC